jgi:tetratricopeptide (TPR) repeat protein
VTQTAAGPEDIAPEFDVIYRQGLLALQGGRPEAAVEHFTQAVSLKPGDAAAHCNLGVALQSLNRLAEALGCFEQALAIAPDNAPWHYNAGNALYGLGRRHEALARFDRALDLAPGYAWAHLSRGAVLHQIGRYHEALISHDAAIALQPDNAQAFLNRGATLAALDRQAEALASYERALALDPNHAEAHYNRGNALYGAKRLQEALASYGRTLALKPAHAEALLGRGNVLHDQKRFEDALISYDAAIAQSPAYAEAWCNRANSLKYLGRFAEARASLERAITLKPGFAGAHTNLGALSLLTGDFDTGWRELEWRKKLPTPIANRQYRQPLWSGAEDIRGKTLFLYWEQGLGDTLHFYRYARQVADRGARVVLSVPDGLVGLLRPLEPALQVIGVREDPPPFDVHAPLMSLPLAFKTRLNSIPGGVPYITADPDKAARWRERLGARRGPRVGLVWNGGFRPDQPDVWRANERRNIRFQDIAGLKLPDLDFYSLQKGEPAEGDLLALQPDHWPERNFINLADEMRDFSDTAALIENLDLVISVDTAVAHLAGAMGKPVWLLLPCVPDWRWLLNRDDSPWYPTARLFRQTAWDDWPGLIARVRQELIVRFP